MPELPPVTIATFPVWSGTSKPPVFTIVLNCTETTTDVFSSTAVTIDNLRSFLTVLKLHLKMQSMPN